ncbi:MAG: hypothetical protein FJ304_21000 [Planctomycetes bacterium]|nr:hypothetical protein [Planctomycetota bacterium]
MVAVWWKLYPVRGNGWVPHVRSPADHPDPRFTVGAPVRLRGKPALVRQVLAVEWHGIRREFSYIVETTAAPPFQPYWFAAQLAGADQDAEPDATPDQVRDAESVRS